MNNNNYAEDVEFIRRESYLKAHWCSFMTQE
jgi:hypothetical protein